MYLSLVKQKLKFIIINHAMFGESLTTIFYYNCFDFTKMYLVYNLNHWYVLKNKTNEVLLIKLRKNLGHICPKEA